MTSFGCLSLMKVMQNCMSKNCPIFSAKNHRSNLSNLLSICPQNAIYKLFCSNPYLNCPFYKYQTGPSLCWICPLDRTFGAKIKRHFLSLSEKTSSLVIKCPLALDLVLKPHGLLFTFARLPNKFTEFPQIAYFSYVWYLTKLSMSTL